MGGRRGKTRRRGPTTNYWFARAVALWANKKKLEPKNRRRVFAKLREKAQLETPRIPSRSLWVSGRAEGCSGVIYDKAASCAVLSKIKALFNINANDLIPRLNLS